MLLRAERMDRATDVWQETWSTSQTKVSKVSKMRITGHEMDEVIFKLIPSLIKSRHTHTLPEALPPAIPIT